MECGAMNVECNTSPHLTRRRMAVSAPHLIRPAATFSPERRRGIEDDPRDAGATHDYSETIFAPTETEPMAD